MIIYVDVLRMERAWILSSDFAVASPDLANRMEGGA